MLDSDTKRRIDSARKILVGKVPDPKSQVEQITIALVYKFMDDMDAESEEFGGERKFFAGEFTRYGWAKLMRSGLGGHETLNLYAEAITRMPENPGIPLLFREIFKNAYLPYRDPETLRAFLKIIDDFTYDHSERLGDAYEYLLQVLGSQGDAGQFRTPRHIIDFMVEIVDPKKTETVLDPACGTAGFLISSYKHILKANTDEKGNSTLTPDEKGLLVQNFTGYDISPDMVRLSLVNLYLHGFPDPHIAEYDTLSSQERWNEYADVILANPPFMSPQGGIKPHNRFSVQSKRSEVLFVDYMAEHLTTNGRAGIIVPEGVIFQNGTTYKQLRKILVEKYLVAVISLPSGVFNPYSGVKTSILIIDKYLAKKTNSIVFFKVDNDGFSLGTQRREIEKNDLFDIQKEIADYLGHQRNEDSGNGHQSILGIVIDKEKIAKNGEYCLSGERYREIEVRNLKFPQVELGDVCKLGRGFAFKSEDYVQSGILSFRVSNIGKDRLPDLTNSVFLPEKYLSEYANYQLDEGDFVIVMVGATTGKIGYITKDILPALLNQNMWRFLPDETVLVKKFLFYLIDQLPLLRQGGARDYIKQSDFLKALIPLPPLDVQKEIVAEIACYKKIIDGAQAVIDNYRPIITIHPDWPKFMLGDICAINPETIIPHKDFPNQTIFYIDISSVENETGRFLGYTEVESSEAPSRARRGIRVGDVLLSTVRPNLKAFTLINELLDRAIASTGFAVLRAKNNIVDPSFLFASICSDYAVSQMINMMGKGAYPSINQSDVSSIKIPLPPLTTQQAIVAEIEAEQTLVAANRELIQRFEKKIQATLARIWGEDVPAGRGEASG